MVIPDCQYTIISDKVYRNRTEWCQEMDLFRTGILSAGRDGKGCNYLVFAHIDCENGEEYADMAGIFYSIDCRWNHLFSDFRIYG